MAEIDTAAALAKMREPFLPNQISKLPKPLKKDAPKGKCTECGGWHGLPAVHLDYVGHAALTNRLLDVDPLWTWEPATADGLPALDQNTGMWIRLTVAGVTRLGYGSADGKRGGDAVKEAIGDALRNAAMRFGAALDLWHKGDLHAILDHAEDQSNDASERDELPPQSERSAGASPKAQAWARKQIEDFNGYTIRDIEAFETHIKHPEYKDLLGKLHGQDKRLWKQVETAQNAAHARVDDVPF